MAIPLNNSCGIDWHIPHKWLFRPGTTSVKSWRSLLLMFRLRIDFRKEPVGSVFPRCGLFLQSMTPWTCIQLYWKMCDPIHLDLKTSLMIAFWRNAFAEIKNGQTIDYKYSWMKEFWRQGLMEYEVCK